MELSTEMLEPAATEAETLAYNALDKIKLSDGSFLDRLGVGIQVMLLGMLIVFSVLILLWGVLALFGVVSRIMSGKKSAETPLPVIEETPADIVLPPEPETDGDDEEETVAVITAALAAYLQKPATDFRVVSFKQRNRIN